MYFTFDNIIHTGSCLRQSYLMFEINTLCAISWKQGQGPLNVVDLPQSELLARPTLTIKATHSLRAI